MSIFTHVMVGADSLALAKTFYDATMRALGVALIAETTDRLYYADGGAPFVVTLPRNGLSAAPANGGTIGLAAADVAAVDAWHAAGIAHGGRDSGAPGPRDSAPGKYVAYLLDPSGNKLCVHCNI